MNIAAVIAAVSEAFAAALASGAAANVRAVKLCLGDAPPPAPAGGACAAKPRANATIPSKFDLGATAPAPSAGACCARCAKIAACKAWTLNPKGACQLKSADAFQYQVSYVSGRASGSGPAHPWHSVCCDITSATRTSKVPEASRLTQWSE